MNGLSYFWCIQSPIPIFALLFCLILRADSIGYLYTLVSWELETLNLKETHWGHLPFFPMLTLALINVLLILGPDGIGYLSILYIDPNTYSKRLVLSFKLGLLWGDSSVVELLENVGSIPTLPVVWEDSLIGKALGNEHLRMAVQVGLFPPI